MHLGTLNQWSKVVLIICPGSIYWRFTAVLNRLLLKMSLFIKGTSEGRIVEIMEGTIEKLPSYYVGHCDVRDVALAHYRAAFLPEASGHRHIIVSKPEFISTKIAAIILHEELGPQGYNKIPLELEPTQDPNNKADNTRMVKVLGVTPTNYKKTILDMAYNLIAIGVVNKP